MRLLSWFRENDGWEICARTLRIVEVIAIISGVIFAGIQVRDWRKSQSAQMLLDFNRSLADPTNTKLVSAIENDEPLFTKNGGSFNSVDVDHYLSIYELLNNVSEAGLIDDTMLYNGFAYDAIMTYRNKEITAYLALIRKDDPNLFAGCEALAVSLEQAK